MILGQSFGLGLGEKSGLARLGLGLELGLAGLGLGLELGFTMPQTEPILEDSPTKSLSKWGVYNKLGIKHELRHG